MIMRCLPSGTQTLPCFLVYFPILTSIYIFVWLPKVSQKWPQFLCQYQKTFRSWLQPAQLATPTSHSPKWMGWFIPFTSNNRGQNPIIIIISGGCEILSMWVKQCHKPPIWEWFIPPIKMVIWGMLYSCFIQITINAIGFGRFWCCTFQLLPCVMQACWVPPGQWRRPWQCCRRGRCFDELEISWDFNSKLARAIPVINTNKTPFIECILTCLNQLIPVITSYN